MCGISGYLCQDSQADLWQLGVMLSQLYHRGPDEGFVWVKGSVALGARRLSIVNVQSGIQPVFDESGEVISVFNGEIYNHRELRKVLEARGHVIRDGSDAEIIPHAYQEWGMNFASHLNGQFAIALWDNNNRQLLLTRDRTGKKPLYFGHARNGDFVFASEIKALFSHPYFHRELDVSAIAQIFTFWTVVDGYSPFVGVQQVEAGVTILFDKDGRQVKRHRYWEIPYNGTGGSNSSGASARHFQEWSDSFRSILSDAVRLRLQADVEVGTYTSGGIDSSVINLLTHKDLGHQETQTFSVCFEDEYYDESGPQEELSNFLGLKRNQVVCSQHDIYKTLPSVIRHAETPLFRTAPVPMYLLAQKVNESGIKVILTGEGADEVTWGYDLYRETKVRRFWARQPDSQCRPQLFGRMYAYLPQFQNKRFLNLTLDFFRKGLTDVENPFYSHMTRIANSEATHICFNQDVRGLIEKRSPLEDLRERLPNDWEKRTVLEKCQYLEMRTLLAGYLLSSQGDRMQSAHGVEGRCPFLDHRVIEFLANTPESYKLNGLKDKFILRETFKGDLPNGLVQRPKFAYRAPEMEAFVNDSDGYVEELLSPEALKNTGLFNEQQVNMILMRLRNKHSGRFSTRDNLSFIQVLSTQYLHYDFVQNFSSQPVQMKKQLYRTEFENGKVSTRMLAA